MSLVHRVKIKKMKKFFVTDDTRYSEADTNSGRKAKVNFFSYLVGDQMFTLVPQEKGDQVLMSTPLHRAGGHGLLVRGVSGKFILVGGDVTIVRQLNTRIVRVYEGHELEIQAGNVVCPRREEAVDPSPTVAGMFEVVNDLRYQG